MASTLKRWLLTLSALFLFVEATAHFCNAGVGSSTGFTNPVNGFMEEYDSCQKRESPVIDKVFGKWPGVRNYFVGVKCAFTSFWKSLGRLIWNTILGAIGAAVGWVFMKALEFLRRGLVMSISWDDYDDVYRTMLTVLIPFLFIQIIVTAAHLLFSSIDPGQRSRAKTMLTRLLTVLVLVAVAKPIYILLFNVMNMITNYIFIRTYDVLHGGPPGPGLNPAAEIGRMFTVIALVAVYSGIGLFLLKWMVAYLILVVLVVFIRWAMIILFYLLFPFTLFLYFFDYTRNLGGNLLMKTLLWLSMGPVMALIVSLTVIALVNTLGGGTAVVNGLSSGDPAAVTKTGVAHPPKFVPPPGQDEITSGDFWMTRTMSLFMFMGGLIGLLAVPLIMGQLLKWVGAAAASAGMVGMVGAGSTPEKLKQFGLITAGGFMMGQGPTSMVTAASTYAYMNRDAIAQGSGLIPTYGGGGSSGEGGSGVGGGRGFLGNLGAALDDHTHDASKYWMEMHGGGLYGTPQQGAPAGVAGGNRAPGSPSAPGGSGGSPSSQGGPGGSPSASGGHGSPSTPGSPSARGSPGSPSSGGPGSATGSSPGSSAGGTPDSSSPGGGGGPGGSPSSPGPASPGGGHAFGAAGSSGSNVGAVREPEEGGKGAASRGDTQGLSQLPSEITDGSGKPMSADTGRYSTRVASAAFATNEVTSGIIPNLNVLGRVDSLFDGMNDLNGGFKLIFFPGKAGGRLQGMKMLGQGLGRVLLAMIPLSPFLPIRMLGRTLLSIGSTELPPILRPYAAWLGRGMMGLGFRQIGMRAKWEVQMGVLMGSSTSLVEEQKDIESDMQKSYAPERADLEEKRRLSMISGSGVTYSADDANRLAELRMATNPKMFKADFEIERRELEEQEKSGPPLHPAQTARLGILRRPTGLKPLMESERQALEAKKASVTPLTKEETARLDMLERHDVAGQKHAQLGSRITGVMDQMGYGKTVFSTVLPENPDFIYYQKFLNRMKSQSPELYDLYVKSSRVGADDKGTKDLEEMWKSGKLGKLSGKKKEDYEAIQKEAEALGEVSFENRELRELQERIDTETDARKKQRLQELKKAKEDRLRFFAAGFMHLRGIKDSEDQKLFLKGNEDMFETSKDGKLLRRRFLKLNGKYQMAARNMEFTYQHDYMRFLLDSGVGYMEAVERARVANLRLYRDKDADVYMSDGDLPYLTSKLEREDWAKKGAMALGFDVQDMKTYYWGFDRSDYNEDGRLKDGAAGKKREIEVLEGVVIDVREGEIATFINPDTGKSEQVQTMGRPHLHEGGKMAVYKVREWADNVEVYERQSDGSLKRLTGTALQTELENQLQEVKEGRRERIDFMGTINVNGEEKSKLVILDPHSPETGTMQTVSRARIGADGKLEFQYESWRHFGQHEVQARDPSSGMLSKVDFSAAPELAGRDGIVAASQGAPNKWKIPTLTSDEMRGVLIMDGASAPEVESMNENQLRTAVTDLYERKSKAFDKEIEEKAKSNKEGMAGSFHLFNLGDDLTSDDAKKNLAGGLMQMGLIKGTTQVTSAKQDATDPTKWEVETSDGKKWIIRHDRDALRVYAGAETDENHVASLKAREIELGGGKKAVGAFDVWDFTADEVMEAQRLIQLHEKDYRIAAGIGDRNLLALTALAVRKAQQSGKSLHRLSFTDSRRERKMAEEAGMRPDSSLGRNPMMVQVDGNGAEITIDIGHITKYVDQYVQPGMSPEAAGAAHQAAVRRGMGEYMDAADKFYFPHEFEHVESHKEDNLGHIREGGEAAAATVGSDWWTMSKYQAGEGQAEIMLQEIESDISPDVTDVGKQMETWTGVLKDMERLEEMGDWDRSNCARIRSLLKSYRHPEAAELADEFDQVVELKSGRRKMRQYRRLTSFFDEYIESRYRGGT